jgi:AcrR family transcriptional regulator
MPLTDDVTVRRRSSPRADATEARRRQILEVALRAFAELGYNATSMRDIAARVGISPPGLLHHFPDKAALLEAVLDHRVAAADSEYPFRSEDGETFLRALAAITDRDVQDPVHLRFSAMIANEALNPEHPAHGYMQRWYDTVRHRIATAFTELDRRGLYRGGALSPEQAAVQVVGMRDGVIYQWLLDPRVIDLPRTIRSQIRLFADIEL